MGKNENDIIRYNISDDGGDFIIKYFLTPCSSPTYFLNNVFFNKSTTTTTTWHDNPAYQSNMGDIEFSNNCFYEASGIHSTYEPRDPNKVTENPTMVDPGKAPQRNAEGILSGATIWDGYKIQADSPLIDAGKYVPQMGSEDFFGTPLYYGAAPDIGIQEYVQGEQADPTNYALGATVTSNNSHETLTPDKAVDGIYSTSSRWASTSSQLPIWLNVDFGKERTVNKLVLTENIVSGWQTPRIAAFQLQVPSADGFTTIYSYSGVVGEHKEFVFQPVTSDSMRLVITELRPDTSSNSSGPDRPQYSGSSALLPVSVLKKGLLFFF